jgi:large subunit ribosomal protein L9
MRIVLKEDIDKLGKRGEIVKVADGYARNFLLPRGKALLATDGNLKVIARDKKRYLVRLAKDKQGAEAIASRLASVSCTIVRKVGENEALFGSVTASDIGEYLAKEGIEIDKRRIQLDEPIRSLGIYSVPMRLHPEVIAEIKVWVVKE